MERGSTTDRPRVATSPALLLRRPSDESGEPTREQPKSSPVARNLWRMYLEVGLALSVIYFLVPIGLDHHMVFDVIGWSSIGAIIYGVRRNRPSNPLPWYLFALGEFGFVSGDMIRAYYETGLQVPAPFPGFADIGYVLGYPALVAGLFLLVRSRKSKDRADMIDAMIIVTSAGVLFWVYLIEPQTHLEGVGTLGVGLSMFYPLMDLLLLAVAARLMFSPGGRPTSFYLLCGSLLALLGADIFYTLGLLEGTYETGALLDWGYLASYLFWGAAALHPSMTGLSKPVPRRQLGISTQRLLLLAAASLLAPCVRIFENLRGDDLPPFSTVVPTVILFILVLVRMSGLVQMLSAALERHQEAERRRRQSEARFGSLVEHASDVVAVVDEDGEINFQSPSVGRVLGYGQGELLGRPLTDLIHEQDRPATLAVLEEVVGRRGSEQPTPVQFRCQHRDGSWLSLETTFTNLLEDPTVGGVVLNARDVTQQAALQAQLAHQAFHDPLTDLANRALFRDRVEHALDRRSSPEHSIAVLFLDIDDFKTVNDSLGHSAGDQLLVELGERIQDCSRAGDTAARLGGDEFAVLLEDPKDAERVSARISEALAAPFVINEKEVFVTVSVGISISELAQGGADDLLRNADAAMYVAKSHGKGRSTVFRPAMHQRALQRLDLEAELRRAIERDEFRLHYQPLVELDSGRISGFEALVRWTHPERGLLGPAEFISAAEDTGLIRPIGRFVIHEAARQARAWDAKYRQQPLSMSINLSAQELSAKDLLGEIQRAIAESGLDPATFVFEMTERVLMSDTEATMAKLEEFKRLGVRLAVDDFGTGYSSLSYLRQFPIDSIKIAKPFLDEIPQGDQETALVRGIVDLGHNLDLQVVAEGVERREQWDALREMGCDLVQGFLLARPRGAERIEQLIEDVRQGARSPAQQFASLLPEGSLGLGPAVA
jgi:diguanylate cyclase (GGDEF)-like protein/PAS domain S-box-containing protein